MPKVQDNLEIQNADTVIVDSVQSINFDSNFAVTESPAGTANVVFSGTPVLNQKIDGYGFFGDASDGNVTISTNTTLTKDMNYNVLTLSGSPVITLGGFRLFAREVVGDGTFSDKGTDANNNASSTNGGTAGTARSAGYLPAPTVGVTGGNAATNGNQGTVITNALGSNGVAGANSATKTGGIAGTITALAATFGSVRNFVNLVLFRAFGSSTLVTPLGHAGNGSGAGGTHGGGGASGNNGGYALVFIRRVTGNITIDVSGGTGGNGYSTIGGGGAGGNGGIIGLIYHITTGSVTNVYTGGVGGTGYGSQANSGNVGVLITIQI